MNPRFFVDSYGSLKVEMDGEQDILVTTKFNQSENKAKAAEYLHDVAARLTEVYTSDPDAAEALLNEAEDKVCKAQLAEKFLEPVVF
jgi:hypothetical protein